jgi:hypothetical protein
MHSTNDMNDGYMGSGKRLGYEKKKYGLENFVKEILEYCDNREELAQREKEIVNDDMLKEELCLNLHIGGRGGFTREEAIKGSINGKKTLKKLFETDAEFKRNFCLKSSKNSKLNWQKDDFRQKQLLNNPWYNGQYWQDRHHKEESLIKMKETFKSITHQQGEKNSSYGTCWIMKDDISKKIKKDDLDSYIEEGWTKGRKCDNHQQGENNSQYGTCWIMKDDISKKIKKNDLDSYIEEGWVKGRKITPIFIV